MPIVRIRQQTDSDCLPCCIAMVLDETRETVLSWFEGREHNDVRVMCEVLNAKGYNVEEYESPGEAGGVRRIVALGNGKGEGHAVAMDEDESIVDPRSNATRKTYMLDHTHTGYRPERVFVITHTIANFLR